LLCARWLSAELINALEYMHGRCGLPLVPSSFGCGRCTAAPSRRAPPPSRILPPG
jgi:hypothetical protein